MVLTKRSTLAIKVTANNRMTICFLARLNQELSEMMAGEKSMLRSRGLLFIPRLLLLALCLSCAALAQTAAQSSSYSAQPSATPQLLDHTSPAYEQAFIDWARRNAIPLKTVEAGHGFEDMAPLANIVGNARIVELGEATHGAHEFFEMKHRMVEYLATQKGFTIFAIEASMPEAYRVNDFVLNGIGDPKQLLKGMYFWTWNTEEVLDMILWMRDFNRSGKGRIEFTGFDIQTPTLSLEAVRQFVQRYDPNYLDAVTTAYKDIPRVGQSNEQPFGVATARLPLQAAAGHHIRFSGYIRTENVERGYAGLWLRVDGTPGSAPLAFDNMQGRGARGTTPWTRYEISLDVPANAQGIYFGVLHSGSGTAWFDSLQIDIDGMPYNDQTAFDLDFESDTPRGFRSGGKGYLVELDKSVAHSGKQSLRSTSLNLSSLLDPPADATQTREACQRVFDHLAAERAGLLNAGASAKDTDWAIQSARLVLQFMQLNTGGPAERDRSMAENIQWIADQNPNAKIIVWAHNAHVSYNSYGTVEPMGNHLRKIFGPQMVSFGFAFNQGSFRALEADKGVHDFTVAPAPAGSWDQTLTATGIPLFVLDLRRIPNSGSAANWLLDNHRSRSIGAVYRDAAHDRYWTNVRQQEAFDAVIFIERTTSSRPVP